MSPTALIALILFVPTICLAKPANEIINACVTGQNVGASATYSEISVHEYNDEEDEDSGETITTFRHGTDSIGIWRKVTPEQFGLTYNQRKVELDKIIRLSSEKPVPFDPYRAQWGMVSAGARSYICVAFNFDGLGRSGKFQNVRGVYLFESNKHLFRPYYVVGRITDHGVVLAR